MGHEFAAEVLEVGPGHRWPRRRARSSRRSRSCSATTGIEPIVYSNTTAGGYGERMLLSAPMLARGPQRPRLPPRRAHRADGRRPPRASTSRDIKPGEGALVLGCGPVGLAVIAALKLKGIDTIVAADFSPARRALATTMGATEVVDPAAEPAFEAWQRAGRRASRSWSSRPSACPGIIDGVLQATRRTAPASSWSACAWSTTRSTRSSASARSSTSSSASATTRWSSPARCGRSPRARSTWPR